MSSGDKILQQSWLESHPEVSAKLALGRPGLLLHLQVQHPGLTTPVHLFKHIISVSGTLL